MPTILKIFGLRVVIYPNDHRPAHVHIIGNGCEAVFCLHCPEGPPELRETYGFSRKELTRIAEALLPEIGMFCSQWRTLHGYH